MARTSTRRGFLQAAAGLGAGLLASVAGCGSGGRRAAFTLGRTRAASAQGGTVRLAIVNGAASLFQGLSGAPVTAGTAVGAPLGTELVLTVPAGLAPGRYTVRIEATEGGEGVHQDLELFVAPAGQGVALSLSAATLRTARGVDRTLTLTLLATDTFSGPVTLSIDGLPSGVTANLAPSGLTLNAGQESSVDLNLTIASTATVGTQTLTLRAQHGGQTATVPLSLTITSEIVSNERIYFTNRLSGRLVRNFGLITNQSVELELDNRQLAGVFATGVDAIYVTDALNGQVLLLDSVLEIVATFGEVGAGVGQLVNPQGIWVDSGKIYIADTGNNRIVRIDNLDGDGWVEYHDGLLGPVGVCVDPVSHHIFFTDSGNARLIELDKMIPSVIRTYGSLGDINTPGHFQNPRGIWIRDGRLYVADVTRIVRLNSLTGAGWATYGTFGFEAGQFQDAYGVCVAASGRIYIADPFNNRVVRIDNFAGAGFKSLPLQGNTDPIVNQPTFVFTP